MKTYTVHPSSPDSRAIGAAVKALEDGGLVILPTDTVYAIACDALNARAVERLCSARGINPVKNTLSIVCSSLSQASEYARIDNRAFSILRRSLPGPFTFILPAARTLPKVFNGRKCVGIRIPSQPVATAVAEELGHPVMIAGACPDNPEAGAGEAVMNYPEGRIEIVLDAGDAPGQPSTVVDLNDSTDPVIIRQGAGTIEL